MKICISFDYICYCYDVVLAFVTTNNLIDVGTDIVFIASANMFQSNKICFVLNGNTIVNSYTKAIYQPARDGIRIGVH